MVLRQGVRLTVIGVTIGAVSAYALTRGLRRVLYEVSPSDPVTHILAGSVLVGLAVLAKYIPARRDSGCGSCVAGPALGNRPDKYSHR